VTLHLIKLCVGCDSIEDLRQWQKRRAAEAKRRGRPFAPRHWTRMMPKRREDILDGGSLYWVIRGVVAVRQRIVGLDRRIDKDGRPFCRISFARTLIPVEPRPRRPFQGWRYLDPDDAPPDLGARHRSGKRLPPARLLAELRGLGLI
jgi:hypothetical protein